MGFLNNYQKQEFHGQIIIFMIYRNSIQIIGFAIIEFNARTVWANVNLFTSMSKLKFIIQAHQENFLTRLVIIAIIVMTDIFNDQLDSGPN